MNRAARAAGVLPVTAPNSLQVELERPELQEAYTKQVNDSMMFVITKYIVECHLASKTQIKD